MRHNNNNMPCQQRGMTTGHNDGDGAWLVRAWDADASRALGKFFIMILWTNEYLVLLQLQMETQKWQVRETTAGG